ncbi:MAG: selenocysteine-specific translation elongation factor [Pseudonocardiales bacterium]
MQVVATAGHVDHGKSTLVRALTGMEPDRWAEEHRRGMTIDLGFAWTALPSGQQVAFVDVPGHERFVANMLAGVGAVPAVLFVVAADEGWMPQSSEHLDALDALGVRHGLLAVTRSDLGDPAPVTARALKEIGRTSLSDVASCTVSGRTGAGLDDLRAGLDRLLHRLPTPEATADVRLWIDRAFTIRGAGTVVTGTLAAGRLRVGQELLLAPAMRPVRVRGLQSLGAPVTEAVGVSRVAVNLRGLPVEEVRRGQALLTPDRWLVRSEIDVRLRGDAAGDLPATCLLHIGSAQVGVRVRPIGTDTARLSLAAALPLRIGDRALLRDAGRHRIAAGATVLDVRPPPLRRRGAAALRRTELASMDGRPDAAAELRRRGMIKSADLVAMGAGAAGMTTVGDWAVDPSRWAVLAEQLARLTADHQAEHPLEHGVPVETARQRLGLPDLRLVQALVAAPLRLVDGRITSAAPALPPSIERSIATLREDLRAQPFAAPEAHRLAELGLGSRQLAAAVRAGALDKIGEGIYLLPAAVGAAAEVLAGLPQPFTVSEARAALDTTRRVAVPLMELLDAQGRTERLPDSRRRVTR